MLGKGVGKASWGRGSFRDEETGTPRWICRASGRVEMVASRGGGSSF